MASATATAAALAATASPPNRATPQGGILEGGNPSKYDPKNPITIFIIQAGIIIIFCRLLHWPLSKLRQPRVIAEVIGGILLGPSVLGRIPGFKDAIFPDDSIPLLNLVATLGLVLFLFLVGLETDMRFLINNWKAAASVSAAGMVLPFGLGCAISLGLYREFRDEPGVAPINFGTYLLFIGIAMAITAFPVLCRILTELKLLSTNVGVIVLSAGVGNDVVGWILLALCVALVNAGSGLTALWVLLVCVGYTIFLAYIVRPLFMRFLERSGSLQKGPSQSVVAITLLMALTSAFFTQVIGVHAIFGGFVIGLICPHEGGFAIKLTEKVEDLVSTLFLPLYFALSGLNTNIGLLDSGIIWGYVIGVIAVAFFAKVAGGTLASRACGLLWRESFTVGVLMSCKGLVELIVLNIGLQAKILSVRTFTIFVVMALVTTFVTTPLTSWLYPRWYQVKVERWRRGETDWDENPLHPEGDSDTSSMAKDKMRALSVQKLLVYLRLDNLPNVCTFMTLLGPNGSSKPSSPRVHHSKLSSAKADTAEELSERKGSSLQVHGVRLVELTDRDSSVMKVSAVDECSVYDPVVNTFRAFGQLNNISMLGGVTVVPEHSYADTIVDMAHDVSPDLLLIPWSASGGMSERQVSLPGNEPYRFGDGPYSGFVSSLLKRVSSNVGIFVDRGFDMPSFDKRHPLGPKRSISAMSIRSFQNNISITAAVRTHHIFFPYFGGEDGRFALRFVLQLAQNEMVTATIVHVDFPVDAAVTVTSPEPALIRSTSASKVAPDPTKSDVSAASLPASTQSAQSAQEKESDSVFFATMRDSLPGALASRVVFQRLVPTDEEMNPVALAVKTAREETGRSPGDVGDIVIVGRRSVSFDRFLESKFDSSEEIGPETRRALGVVGEAMIRRDSKVKASVLVVQAGQIVSDAPSRSV
ncbi:hypothetical protein VTN00DRAFT_3277 [Thermoascus crustaceus]|uniref:uncharacterized protein n=1 Tax=Thermoascus crustaceus TaxID=5088 RepID=UPI0037439189